MFKLITTVKELLEVRSSFHNDAKISFVPTMGALHQGHMSLIKKAKEYGDITIVSIFVNPLQFAEGEDLSNYPRTLEEDLKKCSDFAVDYVFVPDDLYKDREVEKIQANPSLSNRMCGLSRTGHFDGVCTVVKLLFDLVQPTYSMFGEKDYQQLEVIKDMVDSHKIPVQIVPCPTFREDSGLAMSSRNSYLSVEEFYMASNIYAGLNLIKTKILASGETLDQEKLLDKFGDLISLFKISLENSEIYLEYLEILNGRLCVAAKIANTRLIDNIKL